MGSMNARLNTTLPGHLADGADGGGDAGYNCGQSLNKTQDESYISTAKAASAVLSSLEQIVDEAGSSHLNVLEASAGGPAQSASSTWSTAPLAAPGKSAYAPGAIAVYSSSSTLDSSSRAPSSSSSSTASCFSHFSSPKGADAVLVSQVAKKISPITRTSHLVLINSSNGSYRETSPFYVTETDVAIEKKYGTGSKGFDNMVADWKKHRRRMRKWSLGMCTCPKREEIVLNVCSAGGWSKLSRSAHAILEKAKRRLSAEIAETANDPSHANATSSAVVLSSDTKSSPNASKTITKRNPAASEPGAEVANPQKPNFGESETDLNKMAPLSLANLVTLGTCLSPGNWRAIDTRGLFRLPQAFLTANTHHSNDKKFNVKVHPDLQSVYWCRQRKAALQVLFDFVQARSAFTLNGDRFVVCRARLIGAKVEMAGFGLPVRWYLNTWAPMWNRNFMRSAGGKAKVLESVLAFFDVSLSESGSDTQGVTSFASISEGFGMVPETNKVHIVGSRGEGSSMGADGSNSCATRVPNPCRAPQECLLRNGQTRVSIQAERDLSGYLEGARQVALKRKASGTATMPDCSPYNLERHKRHRSMTQKFDKEQRICAVESMWVESREKLKESGYASGYRMYALMEPLELNDDALMLWVDLQVADIRRLSGDLEVVKAA